MDKQIILASGRRLVYAQYGDPKGKTVFYFHGWPASRLSAAIYHSLAKKLHIRIISPDRPGFGKSDFQTNRTLLDWPDDVGAIADSLGIKKFAVMGVSGGGPYAAVCAYKIPDRLTNVGIVVGLAPIYGDDALDGILLAGRFAWKTFRIFSLIRYISCMLQLVTARYLYKFPLYRFAWGKEDRKILQEKNMLGRLYDTVKEAFRHGIRGPELDLQLYTQDWGFDLKKIRVKTCLWYGEADRNVSLNMGKYYASKIPNSVIKIFSGEGHLISITHAEEILQKLVK